MSSPKYVTSCVERFLEYVKFDTQSLEGAETFPSTSTQLELLRRLQDELLELGLDDVTMDDYGYVFATLPATSDKPEVPVVGFIAHVDTSPEMSGAEVKAIIHRDYNGLDLVLPDNPSAVISAGENPLLAEQIGNDIITASGTTLLGADNKAGVAEIMGALEYLLAHPEIAHGPVRIGFTPDEEVGNGTKYFDVDRFGAYCAYTMDGESLGELQVETFSADAITATFLDSQKVRWLMPSKLRQSLLPACPGTASRPRQPRAARALYTPTWSMPASSEPRSNCWFEISTAQICKRWSEPSNELQKRRQQNTPVRASNSKWRRATAT